MSSSDYSLHEKVDRALRLLSEAKEEDLRIVTKDDLRNRVEKLGYKVAEIITEWDVGSTWEGPKVEVIIDPTGTIAEDAQGWLDGRARMDAVAKLREAIDENLPLGVRVEFRFSSKPGGPYR